MIEWLLKHSLDKTHLLVSTIMDEAYAEPANPGAYSGINRFYDSVKQALPGTSRRSATKFLAGVPAYTLHKQRRYKFKRNKFIIKGIDDLWQGDLAT